MAQSVRAFAAFRSAPGLSGVTWLTPASTAASKRRASAMHHEAHTDQGSVLRPDQFAIAANMDGSFALFMPKFPEGAALPRSVLLLVAVAAKINDEAWIDEMIRDLDVYR
jgi:hypothetical protein